MARFRAPSPSSASESTVTADPPQDDRAQPLPARGHAPKPHITSRRTPAAHRLSNTKVVVEDAARRLKRTKWRAEPCIAYVGNIGPEVEESDLIALFKPYGILSAKIHCCGGVAMTVKPPPASYHQNLKVSQYGIVVFESKIARHNACKIGGTLAGRELVVSVAITELPEVQERIKRRLNDYVSKLEPPDTHRAQKSALRSLKIEPTVLLDHEYEKNQRMRPRPFRFMGVSFQGAIM